MGWFLDVYLAYAYKTLLRIWRARGSETWPECAATVRSASLYRAGFGCSTVEVVYTYIVEGSTYGGMYEKPFISPESAENFTSRFPTGSKLVVRLKPGELGVSLTRDRDQTARPAARA
jgi:hypothetical protein